MTHGDSTVIVEAQRSLDGVDENRALQIRERQYLQTPNVKIIFEDRHVCVP
jgi:hypothetical protein